MGVYEGVRLSLDFGFGRQIQRGAERKVEGVGVNDPGRGAVDFVDVSGKALAVVLQQLRVADFLLGMGLLRAAKQEAQCERNASGCILRGFDRHQFSR